MKVQRGVPTMKDSVDVDGRRRTYEVVGAPSRDLLLVLHGSRQTGAKHRKFTGGMYDSGAAVVVYPDGYRGNWNDARRESSFPARRNDIDDVGFARTLIGKLTETHRIDPNRVFVVGYSNGGQMAMRLVHQAPDLIAGAAVIAATMPAPENFLVPDAPAVPMPVLLIHGTEDPIVAYTGGEMRWWARTLFQVGGRNLSMPRTAAYFAERNGITAPPVTTALPAANGRTSVERTAYHQAGRPPVTLYTVHGGGHTIPGPVKTPTVLGRTNQDITTARLVEEGFGISADH